MGLRETLGELLWGQQEAAPALNPTAAIIKEFDGQCITLENYIDSCRESGLSFSQIADMRAVQGNCQMEINPKGIELLQEGLRSEGVTDVDKPLDVTGCTGIQFAFNPWSTAYSLKCTEDALHGATELQNAVFICDGRQRMDVPTLIGVKADGLSLVAGENGEAGNVNLNFQSSSVCNAHLLGNNNRLAADASDLSGLNAENCRNLALDITSSTIVAGADGQPACFDGATLAPSANLMGCDIDATFHGAALGDVNLCNSLLRTEGMFQGASFGAGANLAGAIADPRVIIGANFGGTEITPENVCEFMASQGMLNASAAGYAAAVQSAATPEVAMGGNIEVALSAALAAKPLLGCSVADMRQDGEVIPLSALNEINYCRTDHSAQYALGAGSTFPA